MKNSRAPEKPWKDIVRCVSEDDRRYVKEVQLILSLPMTGEMDEPTISHIRGIQRIFNMRSTGILDEYTMQYIRELRWVDRDAL